MTGLIMGRRRPAKVIGAQRVGFVAYLQVPFWWCAPSGSAAPSHGSAVHPFNQQELPLKEVAQTGDGDEIKGGQPFLVSLQWVGRPSDQTSCRLTLMTAQTSASRSF